MTTSSPYLNLTLFNSTTDQSGSFIDWQLAVSGSSNSNMVKIDNYSGSASGSITALNTSITGSLNSISGSMNIITGSLTTMFSQITSLGLRLAKLGEFSGAGQADFNNISGSYTHLLIIGVAAGNYNDFNVDVGVDFNTDANSSNYSSLQWLRQMNPTNFEFMSEIVNGAITIANVPGIASPTGYGGPFIALIPNYSSSTGFYKTGMGFSAMHHGGYEGSLQGGAWKSTNAITRVRIFATIGTSTRYDFISGTKITMYGLG